MLAIASENHEDLTRLALDDWYLSEQKHYETFAAKYPIDNELYMQEDKISKMREWCEKAEIKFTPTFFISINNSSSTPKFFQLPEIYSVADLKYFFSI
ncbi:hypothetical protein [Niabella hibiscisoli]|uniref:hypothetical protein n=1 Tax=Niabella hibiscisoli TaxID=1825928 RepID=UPI001F0E96F5|nr:hypothetical protein [Niabella hibiscisoli]MCH5716250.1 hypothetical protein [Niabella hibiscisoli]